MLLLPVKVTLITHVRLAEREPVPVSERSSEWHQGAGRLSLMGIKDVSFEVGYDIVLVRGDRCAETDKPSLSGKVRHLARGNGRPLPEGIYSLDRLPECRLGYFGGRWKVHFS